MRVIDIISLWDGMQMTLLKFMLPIPGVNELRFDVVLSNWVLGIQ